MKTLGIIPSRYGSSRFPGKPLADLAGKPLVAWVVEAVKKAKSLDDVIVATDDTRIVVVREDDLEVGMIVDAVTGVITLNGEHIDAAKSVDNENSRFITGVGKVEEERLIILLNLEAIIGLQDEIK